MASESKITLRNVCRAASALTDSIAELAGSIEKKRQSGIIDLVALADATDRVNMQAHEVVLKLDELQWSEELRLLSELGPGLG